MDLFEYQAKELFAEYGVPVPRGSLAATPVEARVIAAGFADAGTPRVVVKAQVKTGGRGKAGGVKVADGPDAGGDQGDRHPRHGHQGPHGAHGPGRGGQRHRRGVLPVLPARPGGAHLRVDLLGAGRDGDRGGGALQPGCGRPDPDRPANGVDAAKAAEIVAAGQLPEQARAGAAMVAERLWAVFTDEDATLVEVNPLILTADGRVVALDGKVTLDDNAAYRQDHDRFADPTAADPLEARAKAKHLNYVKLEGEVGIIGNGAGLVMSTLDVVALAGEAFGGIRPANFLDIGGGASAEVMANGLEIVLSDASVRSVLVNVFGGITSCDEVANGIVSALGMLTARGEQVTHPIVVRLDGNNAAEGRRILAEADLAVVEQVDTMDDAARRAAELAASGQRAAAPATGA